MSHRNRSSIIIVAVFLAIILVILPVSAVNATPTTNVTINQSANVTPTLTMNQTINATPTATLTTTKIPKTTLTKNITPNQTANATPTATVPTTTRVTTIVTTVNATVSATETPTTGSVMVYSSPTGASILIDGVYAGTTPGNVNGVPAGNHILRLTLSGYYDYEGSIYVVPGQTAQGYGTLQPTGLISPAQTPVPTVIVPVIVPVVTATPAPTQDPGLLGNSSVIVAIIGAISVLIAAGASVFTHVKPPKKE